VTEVTPSPFNESYERSEPQIPLDCISYFHVLYALFLILILDVKGLRILIFCAAACCFVSYWIGFSDGGFRQQTGGFHSSQGFEFRGSDPFAEFFKMHTGGMPGFGKLHQVLLRKAAI
jgi:hypothetical protein